MEDLMTIEGNARAVRVVLADDHLLLGEAIQSALVKSGDYQVTTVGTLPDLCAKLGESEFDIILLDLKMPGMTGLSSVQTVLSKKGQAKVVLFSGQADAHFVAESVALGVHSFIPKTMPLRSLQSALSLIDSGQAFIPVVADINKRRGAPEAAASLTDRELSILKMVADGMTNKEIARDMALSEVNIKMHMRSICKKLGARNRAHAATISRERMII